VTQTPIARLRRIRDLAAAGEFGVDGEWLAVAIGAYLESARHGLTLDQAFGLVPGAGGEPWWRTDARARRDQLVGDLVRILCPFGGSIGQQRNILLRELHRFEIRWQRIDRYRTAMPAGYDQVRGLLFEIFSLTRDLHSGATSPRTVPAGKTYLARILRRRAPATDRRAQTLLAARRRAPQRAVRISKSVPRKGADLSGS
jgi:hypothetical protein